MMARVGLVGSAMAFFIFMSAALSVRAGMPERPVWYESYDKGLEMARERRRPVVILFYLATIKASHELFVRLGEDPLLIAQLQDFVRIRLDEPDCGVAIGIYGVWVHPTVIVLDRWEREVGRLSFPQAGDGWVETLCGLLQQARSPVEEPPHGSGGHHWRPRVAPAAPFRAGTGAAARGAAEVGAAIGRRPDVQKAVEWLRSQVRSLASAARPVTVPGKPTAPSATLAAGPMPRGGGPPGQPRPGTSRSSGCVRAPSLGRLHERLRQAQRERGERTGVASGDRGCREFLSRARQAAERARRDGAAEPRSPRVPSDETSGPALREMLELLDRR